MKALLKTLIVVALPAAVMAQSPLPIGSVTVSAPTTVATLDMNKLKGEPSRMAWSPDHSEIYLQTIEGEFHKPVAIRHYIIKAADGKVKDLKGEPEWFNAFWTVKSHKSSPDTPALDIELQQDKRVEKTTNVPRGGELARGGVDTGGTGTSAGDAIAAATNQQTLMVYTMKLNGQAIGEFTNSVIVPGLTFAWAPAGSKAIAYAEPKGGKLVLMSSEGKRQSVDGTKDALLPMWSADAKKLAWLQAAGKKKFELKVADVR